MRPLLFVFLSFSLVVACGSGSSSSSGDGGGAGDLAASECQTRADCRLYSSYCKSAPCMCLALARGAVDPPCLVGTQSCLVDPCANDSLDCQHNACVLVTP